MESDLRQRSYSVLLVSASERVRSALDALLPASVFDPVYSVSSVAAAKRAAAERAFDLVLISSPLPDDPGIRFAVDLSASGCTVALLLVGRELYDEIHTSVSPHGVFLLAKPTTQENAAQAIDWLVSARERLRSFEKKTRSLEDMMEEIRLVNRAKWALIHELGMSEPEAHRYIEKQAMDRCVSKRELAQELIRLYG